MGPHAASPRRRASTTARVGSAASVGAAAAAARATAMAQVDSGAPARASGGRLGALARRDAIREILSRGVVTSQDDLQRALAGRGIVAAQATVSRDLVVLGVGRAAAPDGPRYQLARDDGALPIDPVRGLVDAVLTNDVLVIVRTKAGAASTVARAIDDAHLRDALGTIAGDDTIFVAPAASSSASARRGTDGTATRLARQLRRLFSV